MSSVPRGRDLQHIPQKGESIRPTSFGNELSASGWLAERLGFELTVRLAKFAFEFSAEFPASSAELGFGEIFAP
jgi:hypothetical protein